MKTSNVEVICPMITPFDSDGKPSKENLKVFLDDMKEFGINKIFVNVRYQWINVCSATNSAFCSN